MRKLMWITIGFALPCGLCTYGILQQKWILPSALLLFVLFLLGQICKQRSVWIHRLSSVFFGCALGFVWFLGYNTLYLSSLDSLAGTESALQITASDYGVDTSYGTQIDGIIVQDGKRYQIRTYLKERQNICPGDTVAGNFSVEFVRQEASNYFNSKGIFLFAYEESEITVSQSKDLPIWCFPAVLLDKIESLLDASFPQDTSPFAKALLLGDSSDLDYATDTSFKVSGIRHIIAVSGLHISILYGLICILTLRRRFLTAAVGIPILILFAAVAGFTPSVVRACIMVSYADAESHGSCLGEPADVCILCCGNSSVPDACPQLAENLLPEKIYPEETAVHGVQQHFRYSQCHEPGDTPVCSVFRCGQSGWHINQRIDIVGGKLRFLRYHVCLPAWVSYARCGSHPGVCFILAYSICSSCSENPGIGTVGGGVYKEHIHRNMAHICVYPAGGIFAVEKETAGCFYLLLYDWTLLCAAGILGRTFDGFCPDHHAGCGSGTEYPSAK